MLAVVLPEVYSGIKLDKHRSLPPILTVQSGLVYPPIWGSRSMTAIAEAAF